jgi:hypothetical protein
VDQTRSKMNSKNFLLVQHCTEDGAVKCAPPTQATLPTVCALKIPTSLCFSKPVEIDQFEFPTFSCFSSHEHPCFPSLNPGEEMRSIQVGSTSPHFNVLRPFVALSSVCCVSWIRRSCCRFMTAGSSFCAS